MGSSTDDINSYMGIVFPFLIVLCVYIVYWFSERGQGFPWHTYITTTICYFASLGIICLVPIDIATVIMDRQSTLTGTDPVYQSNSNQVSKAYSTFFILVMVFAQIVMILEEYYNYDGNFTILSRLWSALQAMTRDMVLAAIVGAIVLGILIQYKVVPSDGEALQLTAVVITNTIYEFFLMFLLGYGLIEFPRRFWLDANIEGRLLRTQIKAASDFADIRERQVNMSIEFANAMKTNEKLGSTPGHSKELAEAMKIIISELPDAGFNATRSGEVAYDPKSVKAKSPKITIASLGALRTRINTAKSQYRMALAKVEKTKLLAYHLEDLMEARNRNDPSQPGFDGIQKISWSLSGTTSSVFQYQWHLKYRPWLLRLVSLGWGMLSVFSFIGVVCSFNGVNVTSTPYFQAVHSSNVSTGAVVIFILVTFGYTVYITFWSLFQMRLGGLMELVAGETTPLSLSFNARMVARLAAPLVFFYLGWLAENGCGTVDQYWINNKAPVDPIEMTSSFAQFYQLQKIAFIRQSFGTIFPSILIVFLVMVITDFYNWLCVKTGAGWAQFGIPRVTAEQEREGKRRLVDDKKKTLNAARRKRMLSFLLAPKGGDDGQESSDLASGGAAASSSLFSRLWGVNRSLAESEHQALETNAKKAAPMVRDVTPPSDLAGMLEMKGTGRIFSSWKEWWAEVRAPGVVYFFADRAPPPNFIDSTAPPPVELLDVIDFKIDSSNLLRLYTIDSELTLRFKSSVECDTWRRLLIEWKDFSVDHGRDYMMRNSPLSKQFGNDLEKGRNLSLSSAASNPSFAASHALTVPEEAKPAAINSQIELKSTGTGLLGGGGFSKCHISIDEASSSLIATKSSGPGEKPFLTVHLPEAVDIVASRDYGASYFDIQMDDVTYKFRAATETEGKKLVDGLNNWKEYLLMNMTN